MSTSIYAALNQLCDATGRHYTVQEHDYLFVLTMPGGGVYPACTGQEMVERLVRMTIAARGRVR